MAGTLQGDQRALLQLLYERGQSYDDISGLLGVPVDEVRERARAALEQIGGGDPDAELPLTDFLLGKADPIGRADAIRHLQGDAEALALAERIQTALTLLAPDAKPVKLPEPRGRTRKAALPIGADANPTTGLADEPSPQSAPGPGAKLVSSPRSWLFAALAGIGLVAVIAILAVAGVFGGADADPEAGADAAGQSAEESAQRQITSVDLRPVDGSGVAGKAEFRLIDDQQLVIDLEVQGLDPTPPKGTAYLLWLILGQQAGYPVSAPLVPDENGAFENRLAIPTDVAVTFGSQASAVRISQTPVSDLRKQVRTATEQQSPILPFVGTDLASGDIPLVRDGKGKGGGRQGGGAAESEQGADAGG